MDLPEQIARVVGSLIGSAAIGWIFGNTRIGLCCGAWITLAFWEMRKREVTTSAVATDPVEMNAPRSVGAPGELATNPECGKEASE